MRACVRVRVCASGSEKVCEGALLQYCYYKFFSQHFSLQQLFQADAKSPERGGRHVAAAAEATSWRRNIKRGWKEEEEIGASLGTRKSVEGHFL